MSARRHVVEREVSFNKHEIRALQRMVQRTRDAMKESAWDAHPPLDRIEEKLERAIRAMTNGVRP